MDDCFDGGLNAPSAKADLVEREASRVAYQFTDRVSFQSKDLPWLLIAADVHLITMRDPAASSPGKSPVCRKRDWPGVRCRPADIDVGDVDGLVGALHVTERAIASGRKSGVPQIDQCHSSVDRIPALGFLETEHRRI